MGEAWQIISLQERQETIEIISEENKTASWIVRYHLSRTVETSKELGEEAKVIQAPVLYLSGEHSIFREMAQANAEFLKARLPNIRIECIKHGIHDLQLHRPKELGSLILESLERS